MIFMTMTRTTEIDCSFMSLTQCFQDDSYGIENREDCRNCAVDCTISVPERKYRDWNRTIIKWWLQTGKGYVLRENPGMCHVPRENPGTCHVLR